MKSSRILCFTLIFTLLAGCIAFSRLRPAKAFDERNLLIINVVVPAAIAAYRARKHGNPVGPAILQAAAGGLMMQKALDMAVNSERSSSWHAWRAKLLMNLGASCAESAGDQFVFRMDLGPVWIIADRNDLKIRPGLHALIAPVINMREGAKFDLKNSLKYGTTAFKRLRNADGTIGSRGALAYSNANNFITNEEGFHAGHELVHTFQYRRDAFLSPNLSLFFPELDETLAGRWVDDTGWCVNWGSQLLWADLTGKSRDFDILMEREAYYLEGRNRD